ncbi:MAG: hypothetical protein Q4D40_07550, partial [Eubacteriales bacterium]|nr:hypothetical protein [Eubacteriales bacterium]
MGSNQNGNGNAGGVFGVLNTTGKGTVVFENSISTDVTLNANNNAGGLIGQYSASDLDGTLRLDSGNVASYLSGAATATVERPSSYGGLIGWVKNGDADGAAYIEVNSAADENASETEEQPVTASDTENGSNTCTVSVNGDASTFGGLIGGLSDSGHFLKVGTVSFNNSARGNNYAGGLVGKFDSGVLWIAGDADTVLPNCGNNKNKGNYVGYRGNTLVFSSYTSGEGYSWNFNNGWNDIGNWGQVLQVSALSGLLDLSENHKVIVTGTSDDDNAIVSFARIALKIQLESKGALEISNDFVSNSINILLPEGRIDLSGTGLTGIQRDYRSAEIIDVSISCSDTTEIVFPDITIYGGQDVHDRQGLFSRTGSLTVNGEGSNKDLTLSGSITVNTFYNNVYIGALTAESSGSVTANRVVCSTHLSIKNTKGEERVAGLVAYQNGGNSVKIDIKECKILKDFSINYNDDGNTCFLGGFVARIENGCSVSIDNCVISGSITKTGSGECYVGGLISSIRDNASKSLGNTLSINGLSAESVVINTPNASKTGGLLGWEWMTETTDIQGVTVSGCELNAGTARFGGLVYKGNGYWSVHDTGIKFVSGNSFTGGSSDSGVSGLFLADGTKGKDHHNALYLEIQSGAYTIEDNSVSLDLKDGSGQSAVFDEIIGTTEYTDESGNTINAGIVSIGTGINEASPKASDCSYTKKFPEYHNSKTRYYYNLDVFRADQASGSEGTSSMAAASGDINTRAKMVLYSAYTHCYSGIKKYFYSNPGKITDTLNLTGYSYYPAEVDATIENAAVTFDYKGLEGNPLQPSNKNDQNYGMHTGIFTEVAVASDPLAPKTLNVIGLTLSGTVGNYGTDESGTAGISGALIRGDAHGGSTNAKLTLDINGVTLDNLFVYPRVDANNAAPILINSIGSYTNLNISGVEMNGYTYGTGASGNLIIGSGYYAASSLIGNVGSENASHIKLDFSAMVLDGRPDKTIFSRALFLESFMYSGDSSGVYNFMSTESNYTLGQELSNTERSGDESGPSGRNNGLQYHFFDVSTNVCTVVGGAAADPESFFNSYTRYVFHNEEGYHHELDINLSRSGLTKGCGTINDPYIIESAIQLRELAIVLSGTVLKGMQIQVDTGILNGSNLKSFSFSHAALNEQDTHKIYT